MSEPMTQQALEQQIDKIIMTYFSQYCSMEECRSALFEILNIAGRQSREQAARVQISIPTAQKSGITKYYEDQVKSGRFIKSLKEKYKSAKSQLQIERELNEHLMGEIGEEKILQILHDGELTKTQQAIKIISLFKSEKHD